jgi:hypothetical protein
MCGACRGPLAGTCVYLGTRSARSLTRACVFVCVRLCVGWGD